VSELKRDALGRVELIERDGERCVRRVACGGRAPFSRRIASWLLARERRALAALDGVEGIPRLARDPDWARAPALDGSVPREADVLVRSFVAGAPLHRAETLPADFFEHLADLVREMHARGVCHNDLHKEQNVIAGADGFPHLVDFQLASVHRARARSFESRCRDDLRHVEKHRRRYTRDSRGARDVAAPASPPAARPPRTLGAALWRRLAKPVYNFATRRVLALRDGEERRPSSGPWPRWTPAVGPRQSTSSR
jgi:hypothetical protein